MFLFAAILALAQDDLYRQADKLKPLSRDAAKAAECIELISRLTEGLKEDQWKSIAGHIFMAWERVGRVPATREKHQEVSLKLNLVERFLRLGDATVVQTLVLNSRRKDADELRRTIDKIAAEPIQAYPGTPLSRIVLAHLQQKELDQARRRVLNVKAASNLLGVIEFLIAEKLDKLGEPVSVGDEPTDRVIAAILLEMGLKAARRGFDTKGEFGYWDQVLRRMMIEPDRDRVAPTLARTIEKAFDKPGYECTTLLKCGADAPEKARFIKQAFEVATEEQKPDVLKRLAQAYIEMREFAKGIETIRGLSKDCKPILDDLAVRQKEDEARVKREAEEAQAARQAATRTYLKERIEAARKNNAPAEEIARLEEELRRTEQGPAPTTGSPVTEEKE